MKNMSNKTKKLLVTGCLAIVCVVLITAIYSRFQTEPVKDDGIPPSTAVSEEITPIPDIAKPDETTENKDEIVVKPVEPTPSPGETTTQDANEIVQFNTPEAVKPEPPAKPTPQGDDTNPAKPPEYKPEDTTESKPAEPKAGEKNEKGQIWFPGFGWVDDEGGGTVVNEVGSDGDIDKQVGTMD
jgi:hypothetical protein